MASVLDAINQATSDLRVRMALVRGSLLEGGSLNGPWPCHFDVHGQSCGPLQINLPSHPDVTASQAADPVFSVGYMLPRYQSCADKFDWTNPQDASARTVACAEMPSSAASGYTPSYSAQRLSETWQQATASLGANTGDPGSVGTTLFGSPIGTNQGNQCTLGWTLPDGSCILPGSSGEGPPNPLDGLMSFLADIVTNFTDPETWTRLALVAGGLMLVIVGTSKLIAGDNAGAIAAAAA